MEQIDVVGGVETNELFDENGRFIPQDVGSSCEYKKPNRAFKLAEMGGAWPKYDLTVCDLVARNARLRRFILDGSPLVLPTGTEVRGFLAHCDKTRVRIQNDNSVSNILKGPYLPTFIPKFTVEEGMLGVLIELIVTLIKRSYEEVFVGRKFVNHVSGYLTGNVSVPAPKTKRLVSQMAVRHIHGLSFLTPLHGFSLLADHRAAGHLPDFVLSSLDMLMCMALYPDILLSEWLTPGYRLSALLCHQYPLSIKTLADRADFGINGRGAYSISSGGLFLPSTNEGL